MRIGVSGAGGIGKTFLCKEISRKFKYPLINEFVRVWLKRNNQKSPLNLNSKLQIRLQTEYIKYKIENEKAESKFVSDRTVLDGIVSISMRLGMGQELSSLIEIAKNHAKTYDLIIIPKFNSKYLINDGCREKNEDSRFMEHKLILKLVDELNIPKLLLKSTKLDENIYNIKKSLSINSN